MLAGSPFSLFLSTFLYLFRSCSGWIGVRGVSWVEGGGVSVCFLLVMGSESPLLRLPTPLARAVSDRLLFGGKSSLIYAPLFINNSPAPRFHLGGVNRRCKSPVGVPRGLTDFPDMYILLRESVPSLAP